MPNRFAWSHFWLLVFTALLFPLSARADDAAEANQLNQFLVQHGYGAIGVDDYHNANLLRAIVNGRGCLFTIDTGCGLTCLTASRARDLHLKVQDTGKSTWGVGGQIGHIGIAVVNSFQLDGHEINRTNILTVLPPSSPFHQSDGLFGYDFLRYNAAILCVGAHRLIFKPGNAPAADIAPFMTALGFKPLPLHYRFLKLCIDGELNGHPCTALIDCGAAYSAFDIDYVEAVKGGYVSPVGFMGQGVDSHVLEHHIFRPNSLHFGDVVLDRELLTAVKTPSFRAQGFNGLFGFDLLAQHKAIIDLGHNALWIKP